MSTVYRAYGRFLESARPLPELEPVADAHPDLRILWDAHVEAPIDARWTTLWRFSDGEPWVTVARTSTTRQFRFDRFADFRVSGSSIEVAPRGRVSDVTLRHLLLDQTLPLALAFGGALVLHASGVCIGGRALVLAGAAGAGKSTLAALLARDGGQVMADDGVLLEESGGAFQAVPSYPGLRLFPESSAAAGIENLDGDVGGHTRKRRLLPGSAAIFQRAPAPVGHVYALSPGGSLLSIEPLSQRDAAVELLKYSYRADLEERGALQSQLDLVASASAALTVWRVAYPRNLSRAGEVARAIAAHAARAAACGEEPI